MLLVTATVVLELMLGAFLPELWRTPPLVLLPLVASLLALLPRAFPVVEDSWLLERTGARPMIVVCSAEVAVGLAGALLAVAMDSPKPLVAAAGTVLVLGCVVVAVVPSAG
ncbi:hypothetical protein EDF22_1955 [Rathayibacter sp. PhB127]|uniref:hypothetical protein n=1 Tax=Rathayibacter sp. PhB127 TaxID=2485176 RepID=UPI000F4B5E76|nr:hypothetical protein [Rathayibacter sp. PhB127]ROS30193.1 hypothetical protein EDF22_1955 [Rathayibacter sp. PhB127]